MLNYVITFFNRGIINIPEIHMNLFLDKRYNLNFHREKIYANILIAWNIFMSAYIGWGAFDGTWYRVPAYKYEFIIHLAGLLIAALILGILRGNYLNKRSKIYKKFINNSIIAFMLQWTVLLTIVDLSINQQLIVYTIGVMVASVSLFMTMKERVFHFISTYIVLLVGTLVTQNNRALIESSVLNGLIILVFGIVVSKIIFSLYLEDYVKGIEIQNKTRELQETQTKLVKILEICTEELESTNEQLAKEIIARKEMEIQTLKADLEYQKELIALNKAMEYERVRSEVFANISHDLRTPINIILCAIHMVNNLQLDNHVIIDKHKMNKFMNIIKQNSYRLLRLINNIIDITKLDSGHFNVNMGNHDIVHIVESIYLSVLSYAEYNGFTLQFNTELKECVIACDPDKIERVILNLLSNAFKFTERGGCISVTIDKNNDFIAIKVKDTGIGIPVEQQKDIFNRYTQVDKANYGNKEGSGIGLSLVKSLIELHKGRIKLNSESGKGSEFIIELPIIEMNFSEETKSYVNISAENSEVINIEFSDIYNTDIM